MIVLDVGNSSVSLARIGNPDARPDLMECHRLGDRPSPRGDDACADLITEVTDRRQEGEPIAVVSVVPEVTAALVEVFSGIIVVNHESALPFVVDLDEPAAAGADRYANVAAAAAMDWSRALIVDAGTATTFDVLDRGVFTGGLIAPGMAMAARELGQRAARLSPVPFGPVPLEPGRGTASAMQAGGYHVGVQGVAGVLARLHDALDSAPVVLTGGLAGMLTDPAAGVDLPRDLLVDQDWTLKGAAHLAEAASRSAG